MNPSCEPAIEIDRLPREGAFVLQLDATAAGGDHRFRGRVEHIASGAAAVFHSVEEMLDFVSAVLAEGR